MDSVLTDGPRPAEGHREVQLVHPGVPDLTWRTTLIGGGAPPMSDSAGETGPTQLDTVWSRLVEDLPPSQRAWLAGSRPVTLHESTAIIAVADEFTRNQI